MKVMFNAMLKLIYDGASYLAVEEGSAVEEGCGLKSVTS